MVAALGTLLIGRLPHDSALTMVVVVVASLGSPWFSASPRGLIPRSKSDPDNRHHFSSAVKTPSQFGARLPHICLWNRYLAVATDPAAWANAVASGRGPLTKHRGGCHCGNLRLLLRLSQPPEDTPLRACGCSFCRAITPARPAIRTGPSRSGPRTGRSSNPTGLARAPPISLFASVARVYRRRL
jgi:hypothetical protein